MVSFENVLVYLSPDGTKRVGTTTPSPEEVYARMTSPPEIRISNVLSCAQVQLLPSEFTLDKIGEDLFFFWSDDTKTIPKDRYLVDLDANVSICLSDFLSKLTNKIGRRRTSAETMCALILLPLSMACLVSCLIVYVIFPVLRSLSGRNNMVLVTCLLLSQLTLFLGYTVKDVSAFCTVVGVFSHYFALALFLTLTICSYHVYTIFSVMHLSVDITKENRTFIIYCCFIFCIPAFLVSLVMIVVNQTSSTRASTIGYGGGPVCFISSLTAMWLTVFLPLVIATAIALVLFVMTFCTLRTNADVETNVTDERHVHFYFRSAILIAAAWTLGAAALQVGTSTIRIVFLISYFLLGVYVMIALVCNRRVTGLLSSFCCGNGGGGRGSGVASRRRRRGQKNRLNIKIDNSKSGTDTPLTSTPTVVVTGFRQKDSPNIYTVTDNPMFFRTNNGFSTEESQC